MKPLALIALLQRLPVELDVVIRVDSAGCDYQSVTAVEPLSVLQIYPGEYVNEYSPDVVAGEARKVWCLKIGPQ